MKTLQDHCGIIRRVRFAKSSLPRDKSKAFWSIHIESPNLCAATKTGRIRKAAIFGAELTSQLPHSRYDTNLRIDSLQFDDAGRSVAWTTTSRLCAGPNARDKLTFSSRYQLKVAREKYSIWNTVMSGITRRELMSAIAVASAHQSGITRAFAEKASPGQAAQFNFENVVARARDLAVATFEYTSPRLPEEIDSLD
jgi:hypothetical protein